MACNRDKTNKSCVNYLTLKMESICSPKLPLTFNGLYGVTFQKTVLFITTGVRTSNPTKIYVTLNQFDFVFKYSLTSLHRLLFIQ
jgi:hypothetical protein